MKITEVFFRSSERKSGQQWFEVFNDGSEPVNLRGLLVRKLDGQKKQLAWEAALPDQDIILEPGQFVLIAQSLDLGQNLCSEHRVIEFKALKLAAQGVQELCVSDTCTQISNSKPTEKDSSRNLLAGSWLPETCELKSGLNASPGLPAGFCYQKLDLGWRECPPKPEAQTASSVSSHRQLGSCQQVNGIFLGSGLWFIVAVLFLLHKLYIGVLGLAAKYFEAR